MRKLIKNLEQDFYYLVLVLDLIRFYLAYKKEKKVGMKYGIPSFIFSKAKEPSNRDKVFFILGSGSSINLLNEKDWELIRHNCSIGINRWITHPFEPNYLITEGSRVADIGSPEYKWDEQYIQIYGENSRSTILLKDIAKSYKNWQSFSTLGFNKVFVIPKLSIPGRTNNSQRRTLQILRRLRIANNYPLFSRSSVILAMSMGYLLGFKKIVLCGIDLKNSSYFFEDKNFKSHPLIPIPPSSGQLNKQKMHSTINPEINPITTDQSIIDFHEQILLKSGVDLFVHSTESLLFPAIPVYDWD